MTIAVLVWQAIIFLSIVLSGRSRGWVIAFWAVWTVVQVFAFGLSVVQFGTIWLAWSLFGGKGPSAESAVAKNPPVQRVDPKLEAEKLGNQRRFQTAFEDSFDQWVKQGSECIGTGRWIPSGTVSRFLAQHPAPMHKGKTWKQAVGDSLSLEFKKKMREHRMSHFFENNLCHMDL